MEKLSRLPDAPVTRIYNAVEAKAVWKIRESGPRAASAVPGSLPRWEGWDDASVAPEKLGPYLRELRALLDEYKYQAAFYGHFGRRLHSIHVLRFETELHPPHAESSTRCRSRHPSGARSRELARTSRGRCCRRFRLDKQRAFGESRPLGSREPDESAQVIEAYRHLISAGPTTDPRSRDVLFVRRPTRIARQSHDAVLGSGCRSRLRTMWPELHCDALRGHSRAGAPFVVGDFAERGAGRFLEERGSEEAPTCAVVSVQVRVPQNVDLRPPCGVSSDYLRTPPAAEAYAFPLIDNGPRSDPTRRDGEPDDECAGMRAG